MGGGGEVKFRQPWKSNFKDTPAKRSETVQSSRYNVHEHKYEY